MHGPDSGTDTAPGDVVTFRAAFALLCDTDTMEPRYSRGEILYVNPNRPIIDGCFVVVELADQLAMVKQLVRQSGKEVVLRQFNPPKEIRLRTDQVKRLYRVVGCGDVEAADSVAPRGNAS